MSEYQGRGEENLHNIFQLHVIDAKRVALNYAFMQQRCTGHVGYRYFICMHVGLVAKAGLYVPCLPNYMFMKGF